MTNLAIGVIILMVVNITLGAINSILNGEYNKDKLLKGVYKAILIIACTIGVYYAGYLNPDIVAVDIDGTKVNLLTGIYSMLFGAFVIYGAKDIKKLTELIMPKIGKDNK